MTHKTIFITGSTDGIGKLAATKLAKSGHHIILHGRNPEKLANVKAEIISLSGNQNIEGYVADFSNLDDVSRMANQIKVEQPTIDVLVNNAGVFKVANPIANNGLDVRIVVNYLAPYLLTNSLLPSLQNSKEPRIINLSSAAQESVSLKSFEKNSTLSHDQAYAQSKLAILLWSFDFAKQHKDISTIALNPGSLLNTNMVKEAYGKFWSSADKGADIIIHLATNSSYVDKSGQYFDNDRGQFGEAHSDAYQKQTIESLVKKTKDLLGSLV